MRTKVTKGILGTTLLLYTLQGTLTAAPLADGQTKFLGNITKSSIGTEATFDDYWNQVTPENSGKWFNVESSRDSYDWSELDDDYNYAQSKGFLFKEHALVWGQSEPSWLASLPAADIRAEVEEWISDYFDRYPNTKIVDVVNEPIAAPPSQAVRNALGGDSNWAWVKWVYEKAKLHKPADCLLIINEYDIVKNSTKRNTYKQIISMLKSHNLLGGIGEQGHFLEGTSASAIQNVLNELDDFGLPLYITEYDVSNSNDTTQKNIYMSQFPVMWEHPAVKGITLWGYRQGAMWRTDGYLLRSDGTERPALQWLRDYLNPTSTTLMDLSFDGTATGTAPGGWTLNTPSNTSVLVVNDPSSTDKSMKLTDNNGSAYATAWRSFTTESGDISMEMRFKEATAGSGIKIHLRSGSTIAVDISSRNGALAYRNSTSDVMISGTTLSSNTWYTLKIVAKPGTDRFDLYLNGSLKLSNGVFRNNVSSLNNIFLGATTNSGTGALYADDIKIVTQ